MKRCALVLLALLLLAAISTPLKAQPRLIAITGNLHTGETSGIGPDDETLYEINLTDFSLNRLVKLPFVPDTDSIAFNPENGLLYRLSGTTSYRDSPTRIGYNDNHFMQTVAINTPALTQAGVFNANFEGDALGPYGLPAPRPTWLLPAERRTPEQTDPAIGDMRGPNEYSPMRDLTWSSTEHLFYGVDDSGLYRMTADGEPTFVANIPDLNGGPKGITFFNFGEERRLLVSERDGPNLWTIDPMTGEKIGSPLLVLDPLSPISGIGGLLSLVEHPNGNELWGIGQGVTPESRTLVRIDPMTGETDLLTQFTLSTSAFADLAFVFPVGPVIHEWNVDADGNWSTAANWTNGDPNGADVSVAFLGKITAPRTVTVDQNRTVGNMTFDNANSYTIGGTSTLSINNTATAMIEVINGSHTISAPLAIAAGVTVNKTGAGALTISGAQTHGAGTTLTVSAGTLNLNSNAGTDTARNLTLNANGTTNIGSTQHLSALSIGAAATVTITPGGTKNVVTNALTIDGGATPTGKLDVTDNGMVVDYPAAGPNPETTVRAQIISGRGGSGLGKTWNGLGITSSTAAAAPVNSMSVGYAVNGTLPLAVYSTFLGQPVDPSSVLIRLTRTADANLDGVVNNDDVSVVGANYAPLAPKARWDLGDFDYNGSVDNDDITLLGAFYTGASPAPTPAAGSSGVAAVPEPASLVLFLLGLGAIAAGTRRKIAR